MAYMQYHKLVSLIIVEPIYFIHFLDSIEVGNTNQCCSGSGLADVQRNLQTSHYFVYPMQVVLCVSRRPYFPEIDLCSLQNIVLASMVQVDGWLKVQHLSFVISTKAKVKRDQIGTPSMKESFGQQIHQI